MSFGGVAPDRRLRCVMSGQWAGPVQAVSTNVGVPERTKGPACKAGYHGFESPHRLVLVVSTLRRCADLGVGALPLGVLGGGGVEGQCGHRRAQVVADLSPHAGKHFAVRGEPGVGVGAVGGRGVEQRRGGVADIGQDLRHGSLHVANSDTGGAVWRNGAHERHYSTAEGLGLSERVVDSSCGCGGMLADAPGSGPGGPRGPYGFESHLPHHNQTPGGGLWPTSISAAATSPGALRGSL